jgi:outer membrane protein assembly factor BamA
MNVRKKILIVLFHVLTTPLTAQVPYSQQRDLPDVFRSWFPHLRPRKTDSTSMQEGKKFVVFIPQIGYSPQTKLLAQALVNLAFRQPNANVSTFVTSATYTQNKQTMLIGMANYFSADNKWVFNSDWRLMHYPQATYGLGMKTNPDSIINMDYQYLRLYQTLQRRVAKNLYFGIGFQLDYHRNIESWNSTRELRRISHYRYGVQGKSTSSGVTVNLLYDNRANALNPTRGFYTNLVWRNNFTALGSDNTYQSLLIDVRKYVNFPARSGNVWAFWGYSVLTNGTPPFLDLPSTGWDTFSNTGRGFIQGRFRGKNLVYFESEYRYSITENKLIGGVIFVNAQGVSELRPSKIERFIPAAGLGLRIKVNKYSRANLAIDYGFGADGSQGLYFNLGEVF